MVRVTLPDGANKEFDGPVSGLDVAESISRSLAKAAVATSSSYHPSTTTTSYGRSKSCVSGDNESRHAPSVPAPLHGTTTLKASLSCVASLTTCPYPMSRLTSFQ